MKKRKILAALLALSCAASMAAPAYASTPNVTELGSYDLKVEATINEPDVKVTLPTTTKVFVNPYRVGVSPSGGTGDEIYDTVVSPEMDIENYSDAAITVGVKGMLQTYTIVAGEDEEGNSIVTKVAANDADFKDAEKWTVTNTTTIKAEDLYTLNGSNNKTVLERVNVAADPENDPAEYVYRQVTATITAATATKPATLKVTGYTAAKDIKVATGSINEDTEKSNSLFMYVQGKLDGAAWDAFSANTAKLSASSSNPGTMMVLTTKETTNNILYLAGSSDGTTAVTGQVRVSGQAATNPTKAWSSIKAANDFSTNIVFVIDAVANPKPAAPIVDTVAATTDGTDGTFTVTATTGKTGEYDVVAGNAQKNDNLTFTVTAKDSATITYAGTSDFATINSTTGAIQMTTNPSATGYSGDITVTLTDRGLTTTIVLHVAYNV